MARYMPAVATSAPDTLDNLQPGQWIDYQGARGRYMGRRHGCQWIAWGRAATHRFPMFARVYHA